SLVPVVVQRPRAAAQTRGPVPLMTAARTASPCRERVPLGAARLEKRLGRVGPQTIAAARPRRPPLTLPTANADPSLVAIEIGDVERRPPRREIVLQQGQHGHRITRRREPVRRSGSAPLERPSPAPSRIAVSTRETARLHLVAPRPTRRATWRR